MQNARRGLFYRSFFSSAESPCFVCDFVRFRSDPSASAVLYACDRYCGGLGRVLVLIIHAVCMCSYNKFTPRTSTSADGTELEQKFIACRNADAKRECRSTELSVGLSRYQPPVHLLRC